MLRLQTCSGEALPPAKVWRRLKKLRRDRCKIFKRGEKYNGHWERNFIGEQKTVLCDSDLGERRQTNKTLKREIEASHKTVLIDFKLSWSLKKSGEKWQL